MNFNFVQAKNIYLYKILDIKMSQDNKDIGKLLKGIHQMLQKYSVQEVNKAIVTILQKGGKKQSIMQIDCALQIVCEEYKISKNTLINSNYERGDIQDAKRMAYCLLHFNLGLTIRYIAENIFNCYPNVIAVGIKKLKAANENIKHEKAFMERYKMLHEKIIQAITQQQQHSEHKEHENIS